MFVDNIIIRVKNENTQIYVINFFIIWFIKKFKKLIFYQYKKD